MLIFFDFSTVSGTDLGYISYAHGCHTNRVGVATVAGVIGDQNGRDLVPSGPVLLVLHGF